jgi:hypothetical protein
METNKASITRGQSNTKLVLEVDPQKLEIVLTDDNPNNVKAVFNNLLKELKKGLFQFELEDDDSDLYHHICVEYITQLNSEIRTVYSELKDLELLELQ